MQDLHNNIKFTQAIKAQSPAATGTITGTVIDTQNFDTLEYVLNFGTWTTTGTAITPTMYESAASGSGFTSVADANLFGTESAAGAAAAATPDDDKVTKIGYRGSKRYVRLDVLVAGAATATLGVVACQTVARKGPVS